MDWQTLAWEALDGPLLAAAAPVVEFADILQGAVEESASALAQAPISLAECSVASVASYAEVAADVEPVASFELMAAARRQLSVGLDPTIGDALAGAGVVPGILARAIVEGVDGAFADLLGEGVNLGAADAAQIPDVAPVLVLRMRLRGPDGSEVDLLCVFEEGVPAELAAHVLALRALGSVAAPIPTAKPAPAPAARLEPAPMDFPQAAVDAAFAQLAGPAAQLAGPAARPAAPPSAPPMAPSAPAPAIRAASFDELVPRAPDRSSTSLDLLLGVNLQVTVEIGRTKLAIRDVLGLAPGSIVELDKLAGEPVDVLVNGRQIATGEVVVVDENFGVRITEIVSRQRRIAAGAAA
jgi:flagellar motor switch protein FliN